MRTEEQTSNPAARTAERRRFLGRSVSLISALALGAVAWRITAAAATVAPPVRARGAARVNVRDKGAYGDGHHDDTAAFQAAIDALPSTGGTVEVPAGSYVLDGQVSVQMRSRTHLDMSPEARLVTKPTSSEKGHVLYVYKVSDVEISGGQIIGDRDKHMGAGGEGGHAIHIKGSTRVTVRNIRASDCWGDGICIGGADTRQMTPSEDIFIANVVCTHNRRQGLSIGRSRNVRVYDSEFSNTAGTAPQYGIDIEPDRPGGAEDIRIENCVIRNNQGGGIQIFRRVADVTIKGCTIEGNRGRGILAINARGGLIADNQIRDNGLVGIVLREETNNFQVRRNHFSNNEDRRQRPRNAKAAGGDASSAVRVGQDTKGISVTDNRYGRP